VVLIVDKLVAARSSSDANLVYAADINRLLAFLFLFTCQFLSALTPFPEWLSAVGCASTSSLLHLPYQHEWRAPLPHQSYSSLYIHLYATHQGTQQHLFPLI